jgi:hypothetical protein
MSRTNLIFSEIILQPFNCVIHITDTPLQHSYIPMPLQTVNVYSFSN